VDEAWNAFGCIEYLVNNAGVSVSVRDDFLKMTPESYDRVMGINLRGPFFLTQEVGRRMIGAQSHHFRSIITISSINAEFASIDRGEYCVSKTGLSMMARLFAIRLADHGIGSYELRPGIIRTQMTAVAKVSRSNPSLDAFTFPSYPSTYHSHQIEVKDLFYSS
jgi:NAD(P)-dependent dehydrogenase (short-subunit alcohol dehydrogenase family)